MDNDWEYKKGCTCSRCEGWNDGIEANTPDPGRMSLNQGKGGVEKMDITKSIRAGNALKSDKLKLYEKHGIVHSSYGTLQMDNSIVQKVLFEMMEVKDKLFIAAKEYDTAYEAERSKATSEKL